MGQIQDPSFIRHSKIIFCSRFRSPEEGAACNLDRASRIRRSVVCVLAPSNAFRRVELNMSVGYIRQSSIFLTHSSRGAGSPGDLLRRD